jgi:tRNA threonylcarbamoyladenosine dehydratase
MTTPRDLFSRNIMFYGEESFCRLQDGFVAVVGSGGVGGYAAETLVRAGLGRIRIIDCDLVKPTDVNRQIIATAATMGMRKVEAMKERLITINPSLIVDERHAFFHRDTETELITADLDFVIDAIDSLNPKGELIRWCTGASIPIISSMGAAGRIDPTQVRIGPLDETRNCPLARALRRHLRIKGVTTDISVVFSTERPTAPAGGLAPDIESEGTYLKGRHRQALPSLPTIPAIFGILAANYVISALCQKTTT